MFTELCRTIKKISKNCLYHSYFFWPIKVELSVTDVVLHLDGQSSCPVWIVIKLLNIPFCLMNDSVSSDNAISIKGLLLSQPDVDTAGQN